MEKPLEAARVGPHVGKGRVSGNHMGRVKGGIDGDSAMVATWVCKPSGGGLNKGTMDSASTSVWEKAIPPALVLKPDNSIPPHMSLALFEQLP